MSLDSEIGGEGINEQEIKRFSKKNMTIQDAVEFLRKYRDDSIVNYLPTIHLSASYRGEKPGEDFFHNAELELAREAIQEGCRYVTNMDYIKVDFDEQSAVIAAMGLIPKLPSKPLPG